MQVVLGNKIDSKQVYGVFVTSSLIYLLGMQRDNKERDKYMIEWHIRESIPKFAYQSHEEVSLEVPNN